MIAHLKGTLTRIGGDHLVLDVAGVGYEVFVSKRMVEGLPSIGETLTVIIYHHMTQDSMALYGFAKHADRDLFKRLISVSGVGPKLALQIMSGLSGEELVSVIMTGDLVRLTAINGIGKKTAERLVVELKDKLASLWQDATPGSVESTALSGGVAQEALWALIHLGYPKPQAEKALQACGGGGSLEELIKKSLSVLSNRLA